MWRGNILSSSPPILYVCILHQWSFLVQIKKQNNLISCLHNTWKTLHSASLQYPICWRCNRFYCAYMTYWQGPILMFHGFGLGKCIPWPSPPHSPCWRSPGLSWRDWTRPTRMSVLAAGEREQTMQVVKIHTPTCCCSNTQQLPVHLQSKQGVEVAQLIQVSDGFVGVRRKNITWCFRLNMTNDRG